MKKNLHFLILPVLLIPVVLSGTDESLEDFSRPETFRSAGGAFVQTTDGPEPGIAALRLLMPGSVSKQWSADARHIRGKDASGIQFRIRGNGSADYGMLILKESAFLSYVCVFPLHSRTWKTFSIAWTEFLVQGTPIAYDPRPPRNNSVPDFRSLELTVLPASHKQKKVEYAIADLRFSRRAKASHCLLKPFNRSAICRMLEQKHPFRILCFGNFPRALTDQIENGLQRKTGNPDIVLDRLATTGKTESDALHLANLDKYNLLLYMPSCAEKLQTALPPEIFALHLRSLMDRVAYLSKGEIPILLLPPLPAEKRRKNFFDDYEQALRFAGKEAGAGVLDLPDEFRRNPMDCMSYATPYLPRLNAAGIRRLGQNIIQQLTKE